MNSSDQPARDLKPTHEQIASRAELLWKAKGSPSGQDEQIWLEAERQLFEEAREILPQGSDVSATPRESPANTNRSPASVQSEQMARGKSSSDLGTASATPNRKRGGR